MIVFRCSFLFRASTPDFAQVFVGDKGWLDGFTMGQSGLVAGLAIQEGKIVLVNWD